MNTKLYKTIIGFLLVSSSALAWAQQPALPTICPDLSKNSSFNPYFWQITLAPLGDAGQLQPNTNIASQSGTFQSALWSNYVQCNYTNSQQGDFNLKSKFVTQAPQTNANSRWQVVGSLTICTSTDPRDCTFTPTRMIPTTPTTPNSTINPQ